ncbi:3-hydroxyacyl-CoA dehydrogenase NAD-binding domain-containing protein [Salinisphaera hydrothermalis]|uniref:3-hydroxyacyl-CoA dehydrogenase n=1 Tax=Salinisphaera hydrothermalis (strain C41B8) TaxID=1304275 RepID=A0A084ILR9_SALHC|nr:3-hydroxyacyl-CoA dehydrogenase NAD-binding domain-containing protein [Salinisphaera hydrothermalis]KEZ77653.1 3-hydroxyacyl-CoA dehydrogenase [Salinisphaera hydrothermalis C41B8]
MSNVVSYRCQEGVGLIVIDNPPVNALGHAVRQGLLAALNEGLADASAKALAIMGAGRTFPAGADIREFGKAPRPPSLPDVIDAIEVSSKPVIAAVHGTALGGGMEITLGCDYRLALESAKMGLPEVNLGLLPGAGGTQRLPRLIGAKAALETIVEGKPIKASRLAEVGIVDEVVSGDLERKAIAYAHQLISEDAPRRPVSALPAAPEDADVFAEFEAAIARKKRGYLAPFHCIEAVKAATEMDFAAGMARERELFVELLNSPQSAAQRHVFFAEREVAKVPGLAKDTPQREINRVAVIGAGTMGGGIAMNFLSAGIPVTMLEMHQDALDRGVSVMRRNYEASARKGRLAAGQVEANMGRLSTTLDYSDLAEADLIIEAVFENMDVKKTVFGELDRVAKSGAIMATNTSTLDVNEIAGATSRPADVLGMHFFSPANVMKLLEIVRGEQTADDALATVMALARRIGKVGVAVGVCYGFVGNRMLHKRQSQALELVNAGATPVQVDRVLYDFGLPMGPFAMADLAGLDVGWRIREGLRESDPANAPAPNWMDALAEAGRFGQKTGVGVFEYPDGGRAPEPSETTAAEIDKYRTEQGITSREVSDEEIRERCLYVMINEGAKILEEGIAARPLDIDVVWIYGYGFPPYRGGPMYWADQLGLNYVCERVKAFREETGDPDWHISPLLEQLAGEGKSFADL